MIQKHCPLFEDWVEPCPYDRLYHNRKFPLDNYPMEVLSVFRHLAGRWHGIRFEDWVEEAQRADETLRTWCWSNMLGKPDIKELWRDLTGRPGSRFKQYVASFSQQNAQQPKPVAQQPQVQQGQQAPQPNPNPVPAVQSQPQVNQPQ